MLTVVDMGNDGHVPDVLLLVHQDSQLVDGELDLRTQASIVNAGDVQRHKHKSRMERCTAMPRAECTAAATGTRRSHGQPSRCCSKLHVPRIATQHAACMTGPQSTTASLTTANMLQSASSRKSTGTRYAGPTQHSNIITQAGNLLPAITVQQVHAARQALYDACFRRSLAIAAAI